MKLSCADSLRMGLRSPAEVLREFGTLVIGGTRCPRGGGSPLWVGGCESYINPRVSSSLIVDYIDGPGEQVVDGGFDNPADWNDSGGGTWTVMGSKAVGTLALGGHYLDAAVNPLVVGATYEVTFEVPQCINGQVRVVLGNAAGTYRGVGGPYTETITCAGSGALRLEGIAAGFSGTVDNLSVVEKPGVIIGKDQSRSLNDVLIDGNMEAAGTGAWTASPGTTLTKEGAAHSGSQCLRVARAGNQGWAQQTKTTVGVRYRAIGYPRSDGVSAPKFWDWGVCLFTGVAGAGWQKMQVVYTATDTRPCFAKDAVGANVEWDDTQIIPSNDAYQAAAANRPKYDQTNDCLDFVAVSSHYLETLAANAAAGTICAWVKETAGALGASPFGADGGGGASFVAVRGVAYEWEFKVGVSSHLTGIAVIQNKWTHLALTWNGVDAILYIDGTAYSFANAGGASPNPILIGCRYAVVAPANFFDGSIGEVLLFNRALPAVEIEFIRQVTYRS